MEWNRPGASLPAVNPNSEITPSTSTNRTGLDELSLSLRASFTLRELFQRTGNTKSRSFLAASRSASQAGRPAERLFRCSVGARRWAAVGPTALGLALLAVTLPTSGGSHSAYSLAAMVAFEAGLLTVGMLLVLSHKFGAPHEHHGVLLGAASG